MRSKKLSKTKLIITYFTIILFAGYTLLPYDDSMARRGGGGRGGGGISKGGGSRGGSFGGNGFGSVRHSGRSRTTHRNLGGPGRGIGGQVEVPVVRAVGAHVTSSYVKVE